MDYKEAKRDECVIFESPERTRISKKGESEWNFSGTAPAFQDLA